MIIWYPLRSGLLVCFWLHKSLQFSVGLRAIGHELIRCSSVTSISCQWVYVESLTGEAGLRRRKQLEKARTRTIV